ncbi:hypothetical protein V22_38950 [Calycomorphotria hydatis]|uniref:Uncharacterized protein n=1 Tax=Calycomorphotria hydatis TaxID=2528027 RepID=A0A517TE25_9PLAN|nr:hypothetical protein V22_38950 [Calycomorphotria hydatis]
MFHSIITILTTVTVALHAMVGCCVHHDHSCDSHGSSTVRIVDEHCSYDSEHHHHGSESLPNKDLANDCNHEQNGGHPDGCNKGECNFPSVQRINDFELMLTFSMWSQNLSNVSHAYASDSLLSLQSAAETPPDLLSQSGSERAVTQVWRL